MTSSSMPMDPGLGVFEDTASPRSLRSSAVAVTTCFFLILLFSWCGVALARHSEGVATIWFSNGLLFAIIIRRPRAMWPWLFLAGLAADTLADMLYGDRFVLAAGVSVANSVELWAAVLILTRWFGHPFKLARLRPLLGFLAVAVLATPLICSNLGAFWIIHFGPAGPWFETARTWYLGDALGMAIVAPLVYILQLPGFLDVFRRTQIVGTLLVLSVPALTTLLIFSNDKNPLIFILFPALIFVVFRLGFPGAVLAIVLIACVSLPFTISGHGPLTLIPGITMLHRIIVVQVFLTIALFTCFPVAALLEQRKWLEASLQKSEARYRELANTDALTGQGNRRAFDENLATTWQRSTRVKQHLALLSIDVDLFKTYNDIYGHLAGDVCLRQIATTLADALRCYPSAKLFRLGGEEFAAVIPGADSDAAFSVAELIRKAILSAFIEHSGSPIGRQSVSIGVASTTPELSLPVLTLLDLSDQALYTAKRNGRNRTEVAGVDGNSQDIALPQLALT